MGSSHDLQKYALSEKMTQIKVRNHEGLSFGDLEFGFEGHLKVNIEFLNGKPFFLSRI